VTGNVTQGAAGRALPEAARQHVSAPVVRDAEQARAVERALLGAGAGLESAGLGRGRFAGGNDREVLLGDGALLVGLGGLPLRSGGTLGGSLVGPALAHHARILCGKCIRGEPHDAAEESHVEVRLDVVGEAVDVVGRRDGGNG
jgi:hypothetical protein